MRGMRIFQLVTRVRVGEYAGAQCSAVESPSPSRIASPKAATISCSPLAWFYQFPAEQVGVDDLGAELGEMVAGRSLAAADAASQADLQHSAGRPVAGNRG